MDHKHTMTPPQEAYWWLSHLEVKLSTLRLLLALFSRTDSAGKVTISHSELGKMLNIDKRTVYSAIKELINNKFLSESSVTNGATNTYQIHVNTCLLSPVPHEGKDKRDDTLTTTKTDHCTIEVTSDTQEIFCNSNAGTYENSCNNRSGTYENSCNNGSETPDLLIKNDPKNRAHIELNNTYTRVQNKDPEKEKNKKGGNSGSDRIQDQVVDHLGGRISRSFPPHQTPPLQDIRNGRSTTNDQAQHPLVKDYQDSMQPLLEVVARIYRRTDSLNSGDKRTVKKMQEVTVGLCKLRYTTPDQIEKLGYQWYTITGFGKQGKPPLGIQLVEFASQQPSHTSLWFFMLTSAG